MLGAGLGGGCAQGDDGSSGGPAALLLEAGSEVDASLEAAIDSDASSQEDSGNDVDVSDAVGEDAVATDGLDDSGPEPWTGYGIVSLNLHCLKLDGTSFATQAERFGAIAQALAARDVAAMAVQEACERPGESAMEMLRGALELATGQAWTTAWVETHVAWQGTPDEAIEGVGILARGQLANTVQVDYRAQSALKRLALLARLPADLGGLRLTSVHFDYDSAAARAAQARETAVAAVVLADPSLDVLVAGDFNAQEQQEPHAALTAFGFKDLTDSLDPTRIDHVLAHRGAAIELVEAAPIFDGVSTPVVSDHHGVLVRIAPGATPVVARTRIRATSAVGAGDYLALRGNLSPLTWDAGYTAWHQAGDTWEILLTEIASGAAFEFKFLRNDLDWEQGSNHAGSGDSAVDVHPAF